VDGPDLAKRVVAETGNAPIALALDGVGDTSPMNLINSLSESGALGPMAQQVVSRWSCNRAASFSRSRRYLGSGFFAGTDLCLRGE
jgi:hypothetical protein